MRLINKTFLLVVFLLAVVSTTLRGQEVHESTNVLENIPKLKLESVKGESVDFSEIRKPALVLFLIPKPETMAKGRRMMRDVRLWMEKIKGKYGQRIFSLLMVEPFKTSFPVYNLQKAKLKKEPFTIVVDKHGDVLKQFGIKTGLTIIIANEKLKIRRITSGEYNDRKDQQVMKFLNELLPVKK